MRRIRQATAAVGRLPLGTAAAGSRACHAAIAVSPPATGPTTGSAFGPVAGPAFGALDFPAGCRP